MPRPIITSPTSLGLRKPYWLQTETPEAACRSAGASLGHAEALLEVCPGKLTLERSIVPVQAHTVRVDRLISPAALDLVSIEFISEDEAANFVPPVWFGEEVTQNDRACGTASRTRRTYDYRRNGEAFAKHVRRRDRAAPMESVHTRLSIIHPPARVARRDADGTAEVGAERTLRDRCPLPPN